MSRRVLPLSLSSIQRLSAGLNLYIPPLILLSLSRLPRMKQQQSIARFFGESPASNRSSEKPKATVPPTTNAEPEIIQPSIVDSSQQSAPDGPIKGIAETPLKRSRSITPPSLPAKRIHTEPNSKAESTTSESIPYASLCTLYDEVEAESSRLKIVALVAHFLAMVLSSSSPTTLTRIVYLLVNRLGPDYEPELELGLGETLLIRTILECYGRSLNQIKLDYREVGDLGKVAQASRCGQRTMFKPAPLTVNVVFESLTAIAKTIGKDSQSRKIAVITKMLTACDASLLEAKFIVRSLEGKLRIGLAEKLVVVALAHAFVMHESNTKTPSKESLTRAEDIVREAFSRVPNYAMIIDAAYKHGVSNLLEHCKLTPGIPLKPMLAKPTKSISEVLDRFQGEEFTCEYKYDGERAQVHLLSDGSVKIYSRNSEDMSQRYPDLVAIAKDFIGVQNQTKQGNAPPTMILDCEAVAWDRATNKILPFQVLSTRKRKGVDEKDITVHICLFAFDLLYFEQQLLLTKSLGDRRAIMLEHLLPIPGKFHFATAKTSTNLDELQVFLDQSVKDSCEGLMVKMVNGEELFYEPSKRLRNWLKLKKDYLAGVGDSLDLVVVGAYFGKGKRTGAYGGFLLASYNEDTGEYETTCKIGTGFSETDLAELHAQLHPTETTYPKPYYVYDTNNAAAQPDVWLEPTLVFEVLTADLSLLPVYKAGHLTYGRGVSLRFPRFLRVRDDKGVEDATSLAQVMEFYERQASVNQ